MPLVMFDRNLNSLNCTKVIIDDFKTASDLTQMLIDNERHSFAFISTIEDLNVGKLRRKGFEDTINKHIHLNLEHTILLINKDDDYQEQIKTLLCSKPNINAIIAADNITGTIAVNVANSLGYKIPKDISVIGFADELVSNLSVPKLSYVNQNAEAIGEKALRMIVEKLKNKASNSQISTVKIPVNIVNKQTT